MDIFPPEKRSEIMSKVRGKDTAPEMKVRRALWSRGLRYRKHFGPYRIDIAFPAKRVAVFIDGCFWHGCPVHGEIPASNREYWEPKLTRNKERDLETAASLTLEGWIVLRIWEHEVRGDLSGVIMKIEAWLGSDG